MKKILILGAGEAQVNLIKVAKELEYIVVVCDMRDNTMAEQLADRYYKVNYMNKDAVLDIAQKESVDGVISNSEPAMIVVAYVSQQLGLIGNTVESIEILQSKSKFRELQKRVGVYSPQCHIVSSLEQLLDKALVMKYPIIVKPNQCSGARGTTRLDSFNKEELKHCFETCKTFSRNDLVTVEEYVNMTSYYVYEGEVFIYKDFYWDDFFCTKRSDTHPMIPMTDIYPVKNDMMEKKQEVKDAVRQCLLCAGIEFGEYNFEACITDEGKVFLIEINARQGGNNIPVFVHEYSGINISKLLVSGAVGDERYMDSIKNYYPQENFRSLHIVFSKKKGLFGELYIDTKLSPYVNWIKYKLVSGDMVECEKDATNAVALVDMSFPTLAIQNFFMENIEEFIYVVLC